MNHLPRKVHKMFFICNDSFKSVQFVEHAAKMLQVKKKKRCTTHALRTYVSMKMLMGKLDTFSSAAERRSKAFSVGWYVWSELSIIWKKVTQNANGVLWLGRQTNTTGGAVSERVRVSSVSVGISHFDNHLTLFGWHLPPRHHRQLPIRKESEEEREKEVDRHRSQETLVSSPCCCYSRPFICLHSSSLLILITTSWSDHRESGHQFAVDWFAVIRAWSSGSSSGRCKAHRRTACTLVGSGCIWRRREIRLLLLFWRTDSNKSPVMMVRWESDFSESTSDIHPKILKILNLARREKTSMSASTWILHHHVLSRSSV